MCKIVNASIPTVLGLVNRLTDTPRTTKLPCRIPMRECQRPACGVCTFAACYKKKLLVSPCWQLQSLPSVVLDEEVRRRNRFVHCFKFFFALKPSDDQCFLLCDFCAVWHPSSQFCDASLRSEPVVTNWHVIVVNSVLKRPWHTASCETTTTFTEPTSTFGLGNVHAVVSMWSRVRPSKRLALVYLERN